MIPQEFKTQIFKTKDQWGSGLFYRLEQLKEKGITLYSPPAFTRWIQEVNGIKNPIGLSVDECGQVYFVERDTCGLYRYDTKIERPEQISCIGASIVKYTEPQYPTRIIMDKFTFWVLDKGNYRVLAFSRENFQIKYTIDNLEEPVDIALGKNGNLHILDKKSKRIFQYSLGATLFNSFGESYLKEPVGLAIGKGNNFYVIDRGYTRFLVFTAKGEFAGYAGDFTRISGDFQPSIIAAERKGSIFVVDGKTGTIHQFDSDGSYTGNISLPDFKGKITGLAFDSKGNLYVSTDQGIALLSAQQMITKEKGFYYSKTLDSGIQGCQWHRLALEADIPSKSILEIYYYSTDDPELKGKIDNFLSDSKKSIQEKAEGIDAAIGTWSKPEKNPKDMLFREKTGRYLWLKLVLSTFDENVRPVVTQMRVYYPRISYLRYLPAVYQGDPTSKEFLERFLSIFETLFYDRETVLDTIFRYFDPDTTPQNFLTWLASWLNLSLEEDWPEVKKRQFIREASTLYKRKGTPFGMERLIEIYTGKRPLILEHSRIGKPMVLSEKGVFKLGIDSLLTQTPIRGFRLGDDSILGRVAIRDVVQSPEDPFLPMAYRFTIILDLSAEEVTRYEKGLKRIIDEEKPAHTAYSLRIIKKMRTGMGAYVGISTRIADYKPVHLGVDSTVGSGIVVMGGEQGGRVEQHSRIEKDTELI